MTDYDLVVYLDSDVRVVAEVDPLLECAAPFSLLATAATSSPLNAGVLAIRPDKRLYGQLVRTVQRGEYSNEAGWFGAGFGTTGGRVTYGAEGPQGFLEAFFFRNGTRAEAAGAAPAYMMDKCVWNSNAAFCAERERGRAAEGGGGVAARIVHKQYEVHRAMRPCEAAAAAAAVEAGAD